MWTPGRCWNAILPSAPDSASSANTPTSSAANSATGFCSRKSSRRWNWNRTRRRQNHCGKCTRCIAACPTNAITAPFQLDARRCISYLTIELKGSIPVELRPAIGNRIFGCDDCLAVCPWNRFAREGKMMKAHARPELAAPDLIELLQLDEAGFKSRFAGTPILRTKRRGLLRNVCVALGNVGDKSALPALQKAAGDSEPLIAEHARWAISEIQSRL